MSSAVAELQVTTSLTTSERRTEHPFQRVITLIISMAGLNGPSHTATSESAELTKDIQAKDSVLNTYELLEAIIPAMPASDILKAATKVNRIWYNVINDSIAIDKKILSSSFIESRARSARIRSSTTADLD